MHRKPAWAPWDVALLVKYYELTEGTTAIVEIVVACTCIYHASDSVCVLGSTLCLEGTCVCVGSHHLPKSHMLPKATL